MHDAMGWEYSVNLLLLFFLRFQLCTFLCGL